MSDKNTNNARGIVVTAVVVIAVIAGLLAGLSYVVHPKNNTVEAGMFDGPGYGFLGEPNDTLDVAFLGDSRVYAALSPLQMYHEHGFTGYDIASPGVKVPVAYCMLRKAFKTQHPRVVAIETDFFFAHDYPIGDGVFALIADAVPLLEYHSRWKSLTPADFTEPIVTTWVDPQRGFRTGDGIKAANDKEVELAYMETSEVEHMPHNIPLYLRMIVDLCYQNGATPLLITIPSVKSVTDARRNGIQELADDLGITYLDLNEHMDELDIDWDRDSYDGGEHLNDVGSSKASRFLGEYLKEHYDLPDHRGDSAYAVWDKDYATLYEE